MIIITTLIAITLLATLMIKNNILDPWPQMTCCLTSVLLLLAVLMIPVCRMTTTGEIVRFNQFKITLNNARLSGGDIELAAIATEISKYNGWLADAQYWDDSLLDIWYPDAIKHLEMVR